ESVEKVLQIAPVEEIAGGRPIFLTGEGQLVEAAALATVWEDEGMSKCPHGGRRTVPRGTTEHEAVKITVNGVGRIRARTLATCLNHVLIRGARPRGSGSFPRL